jgi:hypothetical protein
MNFSSSATFKLASRGLIALAATGVVLQLPGCGGGGTSVGAPLNPAPGPSAPAPLAVNPDTLTVYTNQPTSLLVSGGTPPYRAFSSNPSLLPVLQDVIGRVIPISASGTQLAPGNNAAITITVTDAAGQTRPSSVTVIPSSFLSTADSLVIRGANCAGNSGEVTEIACAGQTGTATVKLLSATGSALAGRQVRFEALQGQFSFVLDDAATQLSKSLSITTDAQGSAIVRFRVDNNAITSFGLMRVTDLSTGSRLDRGFPIAQVTNGDSVLSVTPKSWKIVGPYKGECSSGTEVGYYVFGGTPPYRVVSSVPNFISVGTQFGGPVFGASTTVNQNGGFFVGRTVRGCILNEDPIVFITDATGRTVGVGLENSEGSEELPTPPPPAALAALPSTITVPQAPGGGGATQCVISGTPVTRVFSVQGGVSGRIQAVVTAPATASGPGFVNGVTLGQGSVATGIVGTYSVVGGSVQILIHPGIYPSGKLSDIVISDGAATQTVAVNC